MLKRIVNCSILRCLEQLVRVAVDICTIQLSTSAAEMIVILQHPLHCSTTCFVSDVTRSSSASTSASEHTYCNAYLQCIVELCSCSWCLLLARAPTFIALTTSITAARTTLYKVREIRRSLQTVHAAATRALSQSVHTLQTANVLNCQIIRSSALPQQLC
jgi:hypothetical protein